jgi:hypothetical protein
MRAVTSSTDAPIRTNASRARSTTSTPSAERRALSVTTSAVRPVSVWISPTSVAIVAAASCDSSASLRTSSATTAKPLPCSPARAASIAALRASRFVWPAMPVIVSTMPPTCSDFAARPVIASLTADDASCTDAIACAACAAASTPASAAVRVSVATSAVASVELLAVSTMRTCRSAPDATSETAFAISPTARPASSEVDAICCDALESWPAATSICPTSPVSWARMRL